MNIPLLTALVSLRYKLLWANIRTRNGRIFLFLAVSLSFGLFAALVLFGGFATGLAAVRGGQARRIAQGAISMLFFQAILVANLAGFGMKAIFSETELRRYPLTALDRLMARHAIAILDPFWFAYLAFYLGLALGLSVLGGGNFLSAAMVALLLFLCNYVAARVVDLAVQHLAALRAGTRTLVAGALVAAPAIFLAARTPGANTSRIEALYPWFEFTPPFAAAKGMTQGGLPGPLTILCWLGVLVTALIWMERRPTRQSRREASGIMWDTFFDRVGERFGPRLGPLVAFWLRFNCRNIMTRRAIWFAPVLFPLLSYVMYEANNHQRNPYGLFLTALGALPCAALLASGRIAVNQFGYLGGGFRRLLLLPAPPWSLLWSSFGTSMLLSLAMTLLCLIGWVIAAPFPFDMRMIAMLACSALTGVLFLHSASLWVTIYDPSRGDYFLRLGNDLSFGGNVVFMLGPIGGMSGPAIVDRVWPTAATPEAWRILLPLPVIAAAVYFAALALAGPAFARRREKVLAIVEGKA